MKPVILTAFILAWAFTAPEVMAQEGDESADALPEETPQCIPADEIEQSADDESGPSEEEPVDGVDSELPVCEEESPGEPIAEDTDAGDETEDEEGTGDDFDPEQDFEVNPEDEISEDYPVPLPSDI